MKKLLYTFLAMSIIFSACEEEVVTPTNNTGNNSTQTYVPDDNFEQSLINLGYDNVLDNYVITSGIDTVTFLDVNYQNISDLTGIEDFTDLIGLRCESNQLTSLDVSQNTVLTGLECRDNQLTSLDVSQNTAFIGIDCQNNQITSLNLSNMLLLENLFAENNKITSLDASYNTNLIRLAIENNELTNLDIKNGNNYNIISISMGSNPNLTCINVDDAAWSTANSNIDCWQTNIDPQHYFSEFCP